MKKYLYIFLLIVLMCGMAYADSKISALDANTDPQLTDGLYWIDDIDGTPASNKILWGTLLDDTKGNGDTTYAWSADKIYDQLALKQPLEATLTDIADGTIAENLVNTDNPWAVNEGGTGAATFTDGGVLLGSGTGAITAMAVLSDGQMIVGDGTTDPVAESGATLRTSIGVGTGDSPQFTGIELGHASDTTLTRPEAGEVDIEGQQIYHEGDEATILDVADCITSADNYPNFVTYGSATSDDDTPDEMFGVINECFNNFSSVTEGDVEAHITDADQMAMNGPYIWSDKIPVVFGTDWRAILAYNDDDTVLRMSQFVDSTANTDEELDASETAITVTDSSVLYAELVIKVESEYMLVDSIDDGTTITVQRGYWGSTAATHTTGQDIYWQKPFFFWDFQNGVMGSFELSSPGISLYDFDVATTETTLAARRSDRFIGGLKGNASDTDPNDVVADIWISAMVDDGDDDGDGAEQRVWEWDGSDYSTTEGDPCGDEAAEDLKRDFKTATANEIEYSSNTGANFLNMKAFALNARIPVWDDGTDNNISKQELNGIIHDNDGDTWNLPDIDAADGTGWCECFYDTAGNAVTVNPDDEDKIRDTFDDGGLESAGEAITSGGSAGDMICMCVIDFSGDVAHWSVTSENGTWSPAD